MPRRTRITLAALAGAVIAATPATALAAEVHVDGGTVVYTAAPGEANTLDVDVNKLEGDANRVYVSDSAPITVGPGCTTESFYGYVNCQLAAAPVVSVDLGDGNDSASVAAGGTVHGGAGNDKLTGGDRYGAQTIDGGPGDDELRGDPATGCTEGPQSSGSPDDLIGGDGVDIVRYDRNVPAIVVSLDGVANDGTAGENEGDNVRPDVENVTIDGYCAIKSVVTGSDGPNVLTGPGTLNGLGGDDTLIAAAGTGNALSGGDGNDVLTGGVGNDTLDGGAGDDTLEGGFGDDMLTGGPGKDSFTGDTTATNTIGTGNDTIFADDGVGESISCGPGSDVANVDALDSVTVDTQNICETVKRSATTTAPGGGGGTPAARLVSVSSLKLVSARRKVKATITCAPAAGAAGCNGTVRLQATVARRVHGKLTKTAVTLTTRTISLAPGKRSTSSLTLTAAGRSLVKHAKRLTVTAVASLRTSAGVKRSTQSLTLR